MIDLDKLGVFTFARQCVELGVSMNSQTAESTMLSIGAVERDTGLSKDVLRVWERRYGFPQPSRDSNGERVYPEQQVEQLRLIRRLMDAGYRPGKLFAMNRDELAALDARRAASQQGDALPEAHRQIVQYLRNHDAQGLRLALSQQLVKQGIQQFAVDTVSALNRTIGERWSTGDLDIFEEHLYTECIRAVMYNAISAMPRHHVEPKMLLTTFPGEPHGLGLLMAEGMLASEGATTISLGTELPIDEIVKAANAFNVHVVCLSFSTAYSAKNAAAGIATLKAALPKSVDIWVGGELSRRLRREAKGFIVISELMELTSALRAWRAERFASTEAAAVIEELSANL
jgi:MerR family transcriptional regulator, light-induced transcriptional regulator